MAEPACSAFAVHLGVDFVPDVKPAVHVSRDPVIGIAILSLVDPSAAPQGHSTMTILTLLPHAEAQRRFPAEGGDEWKEWRRSQDYEDRKKALGDRLIPAAEKVIPDLSSHIVYRTDASPVTYARYDWASAGSIYGISREGRFKGAKSPVPGLVLAGSATHRAGIEAVLISGAFAADALVPGLLARPAPKTPRETGRAVVTEAAEAHNGGGADALHEELVVNGAHSCGGILASPSGLPVGWPWWLAHQPGRLHGCVVRTPATTY